MRRIIVLAFLFLAAPAFAAEPTATEWQLLFIQEQISRARADLNTAQLLSEHAQFRLKILGEQERALKAEIEKGKGE